MFASLHTSGTIRGWLSTAPAIGGLIAPLFAAHDVWRQRRTLADLDDHLLADIGLTRHEATSEAARPIWDVPATWRR